MSIKSHENVAKMNRHATQVSLSPSLRASFKNRPFSHLHAHHMSRRKKPEKIWKQKRNKNFGEKSETKSDNAR